MTQRYTLSKPLCAREALRHDMSIVEVPSSKFLLLYSPLGWDRTVEDTKFVLVKSGVYCFPTIANNCEPVYSPVEMCYDIWQFSDAGCRFLFTITSRWYRPLTSSINKSEWVNTLYTAPHPWKTSHKAPQPSANVFSALADHLSAADTVTLQRKPLLTVLWVAVCHNIHCVWQGLDRSKCENPDACLTSVNETVG